MSGINIKVPDIGEGIAEVELVCWRVKVGDLVKEDQALADVMTEKAAVEVPAPISGVVTAIYGEPGQNLAVGSVLISISNSDSESKEKNNFPHELAPVNLLNENVNENIKEKLNSTTNDEISQINLSKKKILTSPSIRHLARQQQIDLSKITGSASGGRITRKDVDQYLLSSSTIKVNNCNNTKNSNSIEEITTIPLIGLRRKIAAKMQESKRNIAHFSYIEEVDVENLESLREQINSEYGNSRIKLTMLPWLIRAIELAIVKYPNINAHFDQENQIIKQYNQLHIGVATQSNTGLLVPVIRHVGQMDLWQIAKEIKTISELTRQGKASREQLSGSTLTISSLGALGGIAATPVINSPEVAIVGVNRVVKRPVVLGEQIVIRKMMNLSSSFDHRIIDGMDAAKFIQEIKRLLENPAILLCNLVR